MKPPLQVPILVEVQPDKRVTGSIGEPATLSDKILAVAQSTIKQLMLDEQSIDQCLSGILAFAHTMDEKLQDGSLSLDSLSLQLALTGNGQLAVFGTGTGVSAAAVFQVTLKIRQRPSSIGSPA